MKEIKRTTKIQMFKAAACILVAVVLIINTVFLYANNEGGSNEPSDSTPSPTETVTPTETPEKTADPTDPPAPAQEPVVETPTPGDTTPTPTEIATPTPTETDGNSSSGATETPAPTDEGSSGSMETPSVSPSIEPGVSPSITPSASLGATPTKEPKTEMISKLSAEGSLPEGISGVSMTVKGGGSDTYSLHVGSGSMDSFSDVVAYMEENKYIVRGSKAFDIVIKDENGETVALPEGAEATVTVDFSEPVFKGQINDTTQYAVLHGTSDGSETLDMKSLKEVSNLSSVTFVTSSFSPFAVVVMDLDESNIAPLIQGEVTADLTGLLKSIIITTFDGKKVPVVDGKFQVNTETSYNVELAFAEGGSDGVQFDADKSMTYKLPDGVTPMKVGGTFYIPIVDGEVTYNVPATYSITEDGTVTIIVSQEDKDLYNKFMAAADVWMRVNLQVQFEASKQDISFGEDGIKNIVVNDEHKVTVNKETDGQYDQTQNKVTYVIAVTSTGTNTNINVSDELSANGILTYDNGSLKYSANRYWWDEADSKNAAVAERIQNVSENDRGFSLTISSMENGETVYVKYTASADPEAVAAGNVTADQTKNSVTVKSNEDSDGGNDDCTVENFIRFGNAVEKDSAEVTDGEAGFKTVGWTLDVNKNKQLSIDGWKIKDSIDPESQRIMKYSGEGITINITKEDGSTETRKVSWTELGVNNPEEDKSWTYTVPDTGKASYHITYTTDVDVSKQVSDVTVQNNAEVDNYGKDSGTATVTPGEGNNAGIAKEVVSHDADTVTWKITATIPATGLDSCEIVDTIPHVRNKYFDIIDQKALDNIQIDGLAEGEDYRIESTLSDDHQGEWWSQNPVKRISEFKVVFYQDKDGTPGLKPSDQARTITLTFMTQNNQGWIDTSDVNGISHTNHVDMYANGQKFDDNATIDLRKTGSKTLEKKSTARSDNWSINDNSGKMYHPSCWDYTLTLTGVTEDTVEIADVFDVDVLAWTGYVKACETWRPIKVFGGDDIYSINNGGEGYATATSTDQGMKITVTVPKDANGGFYKYYIIQYGLIVKDSDALSKLQEIAIKNGGKATLENTASWGELTDTETVEYEHSVIKKSIIDSPDAAYKYDDNGEKTFDAANSYVVKYRIDFNEFGLRLNEGEAITVTDTMSSNQRFKPETLKVWGDGEELQEGTGYTWELNGTVLTLKVPDEKKIKIEYSAKVLGAVGVEQTYTNEVEAKGQNDKTDQKVTITSSADAGGSIHKMYIYKHAYGSYSTPLDGARFRLEKFDGSEWKAVRDKNDKEVIIETKDGGKASIYGEQEQDGWTLDLDKQYRLVEISAPQNYVADEEAVYFTVKNAPENSNEYWDYDTIEITNGTENFRIVKKEAGTDGKTLPGAVFTLAKDKAFTDIVKTVTTGEDGVAAFSKLLPGIYYLKETSAPGGYKLNENTYTITIDDNLNVSGGEELTFTQMGSTWSADVTNEKESGSITIKKIVTGLGDTPANYTFSVKNTDTDTVINVEVPANNEEGVTIPNLDLGNYEIRENSDCEKDGYKWTVSVTGAAQSGQDQIVSTLCIGADGDNKEVTYTNKYEPLREVKMNLEGTKKLVGGTLTDNKFNFILSRTGEGMTLSQNTGALNVGGKFTFKDITFSKAGEYTLTVKEDDTYLSGSGIDYDDEIYTVTVIVSEDKANCTYKIDRVTAKGSSAENSITCNCNDQKTYTLPTHTRTDAGDTVATFVNRVEKGSLEITKNVVVKDANGNKIENSDNWPNELKDKSYTFTLTDSNGNIYKENGNEVITIKAGETKIISELPVDVTYRLVENDAAIDDYDWQVSTTDGVNVEKIHIADKQTSKVTFTNEYTKIEGVNIQLRGTKKLKDGTLAGNEFSFILSSSENNEDGAILPNDPTEKNDSNGMFTFGAIKFEKVGIYQFTIREDTPKTADDKYAYDRNSYTVEVVVEQKGNAYEITSVKSGNDSLTKDGENIYVLPNKTGETASFVNREKEGSLTISKVVDAPEDSGFKGIEYKFTVYGNEKYYDAMGGEHDTKQPITVTENTPVTISGLPVGIYTVTEETPTYVAAVYKWEVAVNGSPAVESDGETGRNDSVQVSVEDGQQATAAFTNTFTKISPANMKLQGTKALEGALADSNYTFKFDLALTSNNSSNVEMPTSAQVQVSNSGTFTFENITFKGADTYTFTVSENTADKVPGIAYDEGTHYDVTVEVGLNDDGTVYEVKTVNGESLTDGVYALPNKEGRSASFVNRVEKGRLKITKTVTVDGQTTMPKGFAPGTYTFTVQDSKNNYYKENGEKAEGKYSVTIEADQSALFENLPVGDYTVSETNDNVDVPGYKWRPAVNGTQGQIVTINVVDGGEKEAVFVNAYTKIEDAPIVLKGTKYLEGGTLGNDYKFHIQQKEQDTVKVDTIVDAPNVGTEFMFGAISFTREGEYHFTVSEVQGTDTSIAYDSKTWKVNVKVRKSADGTKYEIESVDGAERIGETNVYELPKQSTATFENHVKRGSLTITKAAGAKPFGDKDYTFTVSRRVNETTVEQVRTITLKPGESKKIDLELGTYIVSETGGDRDGYVWTVKVNGVEATSKSGEVLINQDKQETSITFTNEYTKIEGTSVILGGTKTLIGADGTGRAPAAGVYSFKIEQTSGTIVTLPQNATNEADGKFKFEAIRFTKADSYTFDISEVVPENATGITYDPAHYTVTVVVEPNGAQYVARVEGAVKDTISGIYMIDKAGKAANFINSVKKGDLKITKNVTGTTTDKAYKFTVKDKNGNTYNQSGQVEANAVITVSANQTITIYNLPEGEYTVTELTSDVKITDYTWSVTVNGKAGSEAITVPVKEGQDAAEVVFENHYTKMNGTSITLKGDKALIGGEGILPNGAYEFSIVATGANSTDVTIPSTIVSNLQGGEIEFGQIGFSKEGVYTLEIRETSKSTEEVRCDDTVYTVEVSVKDAGDTYSIEYVKINGSVVTTEADGNYHPPKQTKKKGEVTYQASFINEVKQNSLLIKKNPVVNNTGNNDFNTATYYFTVAKVEGTGENAVYTYYNHNGEVGNEDTRIPVPADSTVEVKHLPEGRYIVREVEPVYDSTHYDWEVTVAGSTSTDGSKGIQIDRTMPPAKAEFTNTFTERTSASMNIKGTKVLKGGSLGDYDGKFKVILTPIGENWGASASSVEVPIGEKGEFTFSNMTFIGEGSYIFTVEEADTGESTIDYDSEKYTVTVKVGKNAEGNYVVDSVTATDKENNNYSLTQSGGEWLLPTHERSGETATFVNVKKPESTPTPTPTETPDATATPGTPTPSNTPIPTPGTTSTPGTTPSATETPAPSATPGTTPGATATPAATPEVTPGQTPTPEETPTPEITPAPENTPNPVVTPRNNPTPTPRGSVLGARKVRVGGTRAAVLGARRGADFAVLGKRRRPSTGDSMALLIWIITMSAAMGGAVTSSIMLSLESGRKRRRRS